MLDINTSEASASLRRVPLWLVGSDGTTPPITQAGGQPQINWLPRGVATVNTAATLSAISVNAGEYYVELSASEVSCPGVAAVHYRSATALPNSTYFKLVKFDSNDSMRFGLFGLPNAAAEAAGGLITRGTGTGQLNVSSGSIGLLAATHSGVTIDGVNRINSSVTIANALYSSVTVRLDPQVYSGLTVGVNNISAGNFSGVTVEVSNILQSVRSQMADDLLLRNIASGGAGGRVVQDALRVLRNRVEISGSTGTVYSEDDTTSAFTFSVTTTADTSLIAGINPAGP